MTESTGFEKERTPGKTGVIGETTRTLNMANSPGSGANKDKNPVGAQEVQEDNTVIQSQQSVVDFRMGEGGSISDEELIDYDEDPLVAEKLEMREVEKRVEVRATKLLNDSAINIKGSEEEVKGKEEESGEVLLSGSTDDDEEIDWDKLNKSFGTNEGIALTAEALKKREAAELRRSARKKSGCGNIQDKVEAAKKKNNEISGTLSSFAIFNSVTQTMLENLASTSNINLGNSKDSISATISTIEANELAKAALVAAKQKLDEQQQEEKVEGDCNVYNEERTNMGTGKSRGVEEEQINYSKKKGRQRGAGSNRGDNLSKRGNALTDTENENAGGLTDQTYEGDIESMEEEHDDNSERVKTNKFSKGAGTLGEKGEMKKKNIKHNSREEEGETETDIERGKGKKGKQKRGRPPRKPLRSSDETLIEQEDAGTRKNNKRK
jgi:hypothetical protein